MNYLCIDYGQKHIGLAFATTPIAEPYETVSFNQAPAVINSLIKKHHIDKIIFGLSESSMAQETKAYAQKIESETGLTVIFQDETLSSQDTRRHLAQTGAKRKKREAKIDHYVAATILQDYLDSTHKS